MCHPALKTQALCDFQTGKGEIPNWTPAESMLKIQTKCSYKKCSYCFLHTSVYGLKFIPVICGENHLDPPDSNLKLDTSFWGSGHGAMGGLVFVEKVNSQKSLLTLGIPTELRCVQIWKGTTECLKVTGTGRVKIRQMQPGKDLLVRLTFLFLGESQEKKGQRRFFKTLLW